MRHEIGLKVYSPNLKHWYSLLSASPVYDFMDDRVIHNYLLALVYGWSGSLIWVPSLYYLLHRECRVILRMGKILVLHDEVSVTGLIHSLLSLLLLVGKFH